MKINFITLIMMFILCSPCWGAVPLNHFAEREGNTTTILSYPKYYKNGSGYEAIDTSIVASSDAGWDWEVKKGVFKLRIKNDGTFEINHLNDIWSQRLTGLGFFNTNTKERIIKQVPTLSNPTVIGNKITWDLPLGSTYELIYIEDQFRDVLTLSQQAKVWLKNRKPAGWTKANTWVGLIYDMDLSQSTMIESKDFETEQPIQFKQNGRVKHSIWRATVKHQHYDKNKTPEQQPDKAWLKKKFYKNGKYVEAIPFRGLESVDGKLVFNTTSTFQEGVDSYSGFKGATVDSGSTNWHRTSEDYMQISADTWKNFGRFDLTSITSTDTVSDATLELNVQETGNCTAETLQVAEIENPDSSGGFDEAGSSGDWFGVHATYDYKDDDTVNIDWDSGASNNITDVDDNAAEDTDGIAACPGSSETASFTIPTMVGNWVADDDDNAGYFVSCTNSCGVAMDGKYDATAANRPKLTVVHSAAATGAIQTMPMMF